MHYLDRSSPFFGNEGFEIFKKKQSHLQASAVLGVVYMTLDFITQKMNVADVTK